MSSLKLRETADWLSLCTADRTGKFFMNIRLTFRDTTLD